MPPWGRRAGRSDAGESETAALTDTTQISTQVSNFWNLQHGGATRTVHEF